MMDLFGGIQWRYQRYLEPYRILHRDPWNLLRRGLANWGAAAVDRPLAYVYANPSNAGDHASHLGVRMLAGRPGVELFCSPPGVASTLRSLARGPDPGRAYEAVVVGGGGLFQECFSPFWEGLLELGVPFAVFGVGVNEVRGIRRATDPRLLGDIAREALALHVRDFLTRDRLAEAGGAGVEVTVGLCPSVNYLAETAGGLPRTAAHLLHVIHEPDLQLVGGDPGHLSARLRALAGRMALVYDEEHHKSGVGLRVLKKYARAALVVSSRLHGCIFSHALGKPFLAIVCDAKLDAFLETHAPDAPRLPGALAARRLSIELLDEAARRPPGPRLQAELAANRSRMSEVLSVIDRTGPQTSAAGDAGYRGQKGRVR